MRGKISFPYIPLKTALYSDKVDRLGYIYGDSITGEGMTYAEYDKRLREEFKNSENLFSQRSQTLNQKYNISDYSKYIKDNTKYEYYDIECPIYNMRKDDMQPFELVKCRAEGLMFIVVIDIPIKTLDSDVESELRFWIKDSMSINIHHEIPEAKRLEMLPTKNIKINMGGVSGTLEKCKLINFETPFRISVLVNKMTE